MIKVDFQPTEEALCLVILQDGHQIGHMEIMTGDQLNKQLGELTRASTMMIHALSEISDGGNIEHNG